MNDETTMINRNDEDNDVTVNYDDAENGAHENLASAIMSKAATLTEALQLG